MDRKPLEIFMRNIEKDQTKTTEQWFWLAAHHVLLLAHSDSSFHLKIKIHYDETAVGLSSIYCLCRNLKLKQICSTHT
jgi:hypothetical protein